MPTLPEILAGLPADLLERAGQSLSLLRRQGLGCERLRAKVDRLEKADTSPVTLADLLHQTQLQQMLAAVYPDDGLIAEEPRDLQQRVIHHAGDYSHLYYGLPIDESVPEIPETGAVTWVLDPIDGTKGFLAGRHYAIAVGFFVDRQPWFGAMAVPHRSAENTLAIDAVIAFAVAGRGAWISPLNDDAGLPDFDQLDNSEAPRRARPRVAVSLEHGKMRERLQSIETIELFALDSQAKYLAAATGEIDAYLRERRNDGISDALWDHMPGALIAREAGCIVEHFTGRPLGFKPQPDLELAGGMICYRPVAEAALKPLREIMAEV